MIRTMVVDDEEPARERLRGMLADVKDVELVGEAEDGESALRMVQDVRPDLLFLDIQMPGLTGMDVASRLAPPRPRVVFCTAFDQYAIDAFELHAVDYLLKPLSRARLERSLDGVRRSMTEAPHPPSAEDLLLRRDMDEASATQARLFPRDLPQMRTLQYSGLCRSALGIGGDYYDFLPVGPGRLGLALGDVSGKGIYASLLMAGLQGRLQGLASRWSSDLASMIAEINTLMHASTEDSRYATLFYAVYEESSRELTYVNAGHLPPLLLRSSAAGATPRDVVRGPGSAGRERLALSSIGIGAQVNESSEGAVLVSGNHRVDRLEPTGTVVGLLPRAVYRQATVRLEPADVLLAYTDGVTEARNRDGEELGTIRLAELLQAHADLDASDLRDRILEEVERFAHGSSREDDMTLLVAKGV